MEKLVVRYTKENIAKVNIFLKDPFVQKMVREEKISPITFVGTVGGLLGLFLGFSFMSCLEIVYMFCIWLFSNGTKMNEKLEKSTKNSITPIQINSNVIHVQNRNKT